MKIKTTLMILGSIAALPLFGGRDSDSYTIEAEGLLPQTTFAGTNYVLQGTMAGFSGSTSGSYTLLAGVNPGSNTLISLPTIIEQPMDADLLEGGVLTLTVVSGGHGPFTFQWYKGTDPVMDAIDPTLELTGVTNDDEGSYSVVVSNPFGDVNSLAASVSVLAKPVITSGLTDTAVNPGAGALLKVSVTSEGTPTYAWYLNDVLLEGKTRNFINLANISPADLGTYRVDVSNEAGTVSSSAVLSFSGLQPGEGPNALLGSVILEEGTDFTRYESSWFGEFTIMDGSQLGWVYTDSLGWVYFTSISTAEASYIYPLLVDGILFTNSTVYPRYAWSYNESSWIYLPETNDASTGAIWGWVYKTASWMEYANDQ